MPVRLCVLADIHLREEQDAKCPGRQGQYGDILLLRAVRRINRTIRPDAVLVLGDLVENGGTSGLRKLKHILDQLSCPTLVLPGNHDGDPSSFFEVFPPLPEVLDIGDCRLIPFVDEQTSGFNARRSEHALNRLRALASGFHGTVVACQHVPVFMPSTVSCPYTYENAENVIAVMQQSGVSCTLAGHFHEGFIADDQPFGTSIAAPALCEGRFPFLDITIDRKGRVNVAKHFLSIPPGTGLCDSHVHTRFAYCNENMECQNTVELMDVFNLSGLAFTEHSRHLYRNREDLPRGFLDSELVLRIEEYWSEVSRWRGPAIRAGLEVDCDLAGMPVARQQDLDRAELLLGAVHGLPAFSFEDPERVAEMNFRGMLSRFFDQCRVDVMAHPFRVLHKGTQDGAKPSTDLFAWLARQLKQREIAAELNMHTNDPDPEFFSICLEQGVNIAFGSDAHNLCEIGDFVPHVEFLRGIGFSGHPADITPQGGGSNAA